MATPENTLISRAEVTSIITPATGRRALVLDGATIELGDTGQRDLSGAFEAGAVTSGQVIVQRIGNVVEWTFNAVVLPAGVTSAWTIMKAAAGGYTAFLPEYGVQAATLIDGTSEYLSRVIVPASGDVAFHYAEAVRPWTGIVTFVTSRAWPTSLPGVVRGQPVGV